MRGAELGGSDNLSVLIDFENGSVATITYVANGDRAFSTERLDVLGGGAAAALDDFRRLELVRHGQRKVIRSLWRQNKGHKAELCGFLEAIRNEAGVPPIPLREIIATTLTTFSIKHSLVSGAATTIDVAGFLESTKTPAARSVPA
jgi:predicted dehydrogenase